MPEPVIVVLHQIQLVSTVRSSQAILNEGRDGGVRAMQMKEARSLRKGVAEQMGKTYI